MSHSQTLKEVKKSYLNVINFWDSNSLVLQLHIRKLLPRNILKIVPILAS